MQMSVSHNKKSENPNKLNACQSVTIFISVISLWLAAEFFGVPACIKHMRSRAARTTDLHMARTDLDSRNVTFGLLSASS